MVKAQIAEIQKLDIQRCKIKIEGISNLISHRWDEKAKKMMLDKQMKKTVKKEAKNPVEQYEAATYYTDDGKIGFPADGFKQSMVRGGKALDLIMTDLRTGFFVHGVYCTRDDRELVVITGERSMREDMVRLNGTVSDIRYRPQMCNWKAELEISYNAGVVSFDHLVNMLNAAGFGVGVGEWRPPCDGSFGRFKVSAK